MHRSGRYWGGAVLIAILVSTVSALADGCGPLKVVTSVDLRMDSDKRAAYVPVTVQGQKEYLLLDTGGTIGELTPATVTALGLKSREKSSERFYDISGRYVDHSTVVPEFAIGDLKGHDVDFIVGPDDLFPDRESAGILGPSVLRSYDVALDFGSRKLTLLSQDHCEGKVVYWPASTVAIVPMKVDGASGHIMLPVILDGHKLNALLDTGADESVLNLRVARREFNLGEKQGDMIPVGKLGNREDAVVYTRSFKSLNLDGIAVANPGFDIVPDMEDADPEQPPPTGTNLQEPDEERGMPDMLIGMDILRHFHLYIAYGEQKLYITPASAPAGAPAAATKIAADESPATAAP